MELPALIALMEVYRTHIILDLFPAHLNLEALSVITVAIVLFHRFLLWAMIMEMVTH